MNSFFPDAITSWNNIIIPFNILKDHILSLIRPTPKSILGVHDPLGLRYRLSQLRVNLTFIRTPFHKCH